MCKKICIFFVFLILVIPRTALAASLNFKLATDAVSYHADADNNVSILLMLSTEGNSPVTSCMFDLTSNGGVSKPTIEGKNGWIKDEGSHILLSVGTDSGKIGVTSEDDKNYPIAKIKYEVTSNTMITISNITCSSVDDNNNELEGTQNDIILNLIPSDVVNASINGTFVEQIYPQTFNSDISEFIVNLTSNNSSLLERVKVKAKDTSNGDKLICDSGSASTCTISFSGNTCTSNTCLGIITGSTDIGDVVNVGIYDGDNELKSFYVNRKFSGVAATDNSIKSLTVFGKVIELEANKTEYSIEIDSNYTDFKVEATLSDPDNYMWDTLDNPDKYNYYTETVTLIVQPKNASATGASSKTYVISVSGGSEPSIGPMPSSSNSTPDVPSNVPVSSKKSTTPTTNPQTGSITEFVVAIILACSLFVSLYMYKNNVSVYK